jgi:hypothetical protein
MSGESFILYGIEEEGLTERVFKTFPQAWWAARQVRSKCRRKCIPTRS